MNEIARGISKLNHFKVIQLPFNLYEAGAALHKNNKQQSVFEYAEAAGLAVLTNRPFNAFAKERLVRLTSFPVHDEVEVKGGLHTTLGRAIEFEKRVPGYPKAGQGLMWAHFKLITWDLENLAEQKSKLAADNVQVVAPDLASSPTLSRKVMRVYHGFPALTSVLAGMRNPGYVRDLLGTEAPLSIDTATQTLMRLQRYRS